MLKLSNVNAFYGASHVLYDISLQVAPGEIAVLLGRNGMGKTTTLRSIMGLMPRADGLIRIGDDDVQGLACYERARLRLTLVPEGRRIFTNLTVAENLRVAAMVAGSADRQALQQALALFPSLGQRLGQRGGTLSGGEQQMLAVARALVSRPRVMLIDEPTEGLAPSLVETIRQALEESRAQGMAILLVEQNSRFALGLANRSYVLERGRIVHESSNPLGERSAIERHLTMGR